MRVLHSNQHIGLILILFCIAAFFCCDNAGSGDDDDDSGGYPDSGTAGGDDLDWDEADDDSSAGDDDTSDDDDTGSDDDGPDVIILDDGITGQGLADVLDDFNISSEIWGLESAYTGETLNAPVVVLFNGGPDAWQVDMPQKGQQALLNYFQAGGNLVITEWVMFDYFNLGHYSLLSSILPVTTDGTWGVGPETFFVERPNHALTLNLPLDFVFPNIGYTHLTAIRGEIVISGKNSGDALVADATGPGRLVYGAFSGASDGSTGMVDIWTEPMKLLFRNIYTWLTE